MKRFIRRGRGVIGTAVTWALAWVGLGAGIGALVGFELGYLLRMALTNSVGGFLAGASFALILSFAERNRTLEELSLRRIAVWGGGGGILVSLIPTAIGVPLALLLGPMFINVAIGAGFAAGSVAIARKAGRPPFNTGRPDPILSLESD